MTSNNTSVFATGVTLRRKLLRWSVTYPIPENEARLSYKPKCLTWEDPFGEGRRSSFGSIPSSSHIFTATSKPVTLDTTVHPGGLLSYSNVLNKRDGGPCRLRTPAV